MFTAPKLFAGGLVAAIAMLLIAFAAPPACTSDPTLPNPANITKVSDPQAKLDVARIEYVKILVRLNEFIRQPGVPAPVVQEIRVANEKARAALDEAQTQLDLCKQAAAVECGGGNLAVEAFEAALRALRTQLIERGIVGASDAALPGWLVLMLLNVVVGELAARRKFSGSEMESLLAIEQELLTENRPASSEERRQLQGVIDRLTESLNAGVAEPAGPEVETGSAEPEPSGEN